MRKLFLIVASVHGVVLLLGALLTSHPVSSKKAGSVSVRTYIPSSSPAVAMISSSPSPKSASAPPKKPSTTTKKAAAKKGAVKPKAEKKRSASPAAAAAPVADLLSNLQKSLSNLEKGEVSASPSTYSDRLTALLKEALILPEKGDVRVCLTLSRLGRVEKVELLSWASERNRAYVQERLPTLTFPPFDEGLRKEASHRFSLTLTS